jgi:hypothetical protein
MPRDIDIAVRVGPALCLGQLLDDVSRGRLVRIAHPEIEDVFTSRTNLGLQIVDDGKNIRGKALDALELFHSLAVLGTVSLRTGINGARASLLRRTRNTHARTTA